MYFTILRTNVNNINNIEVVNIDYNLEGEGII